VDQTHKAWVLSTAFDSRQRQVAWCGERMSDAVFCEVVQIADPQARQYGEPTRLAEGEWTVRTRAAKTSDVIFPTFSSDGRLLMGCAQWTDPSEVSHPVLWLIATKQDVTPKWLKDWTWATFSPSTDEVVAIAIDGKLAVFDSAALMHDAAPEPKYPSPPTVASRWLAEFSPDGRWIAAISGSEVSIWPKDHPEAPRWLRGHRGDITSMQFSPDSHWIVTASADRTARVWPVEPVGVEMAGAPVSVELAGGNLSKLAQASFSLDGLRVVTAGADGIIRIWDARTGRQLGALERHAESVNDVKFWPDGRILSASDDGTLQLGPCHACSEDADKLANDVPNYAKLSQADERDVQAASRRRGMWQSVPNTIFGKETRPP
jgi:WD40 repeat protein